MGPETKAAAKYHSGRADDTAQREGASSSPAESARRHAGHAQLQLPGTRAQLQPSQGAASDHSGAASADPPPLLPGAAGDPSPAPSFVPAAAPPPAPHAALTPRVPWALQVLGGLLAGVAALTVPRANAVDIRDDTKVREKGFDLIYEARDLDLAQVREP